MVIPRFIVHDTSAKEVSVREYFDLKSSGGTHIPAAYELINTIVHEEGLAKNYNIYIFQGTDGDDSAHAEFAQSQIEEILTYANRMGVTVLKNNDRETTFEKYINDAEFTERSELFRMYILPDNATNEQNEDAVKALIS
jgi:uncharacterized sporulation protein YeaH/YhbH (DUF444 family)